MSQNTTVNTTERNSGLLALINQEYALVLDGKQPQTLVKLLQSYQLDPLAGLIDKNQELLQKYKIALLLNGNYNDLHLMLKRYFKLQIKNRCSFERIAMFGKNEQFKFLGQQIKKLIDELTPADSKLKVVIRKTAIVNILNKLAKYFINIELKEVASFINLSEDDVLQAGHEMKGKYIKLKRTVEKSDCLQDKLKQLTVISSKMGQLE